MMLKWWVDLPLESVAVTDPKMLMADPTEEWKEGEFFSSTHRCNHLDKKGVI